MVSWDTVQVFQASCPLQPTYLNVDDKLLRRLIHSSTIQWRMPMVHHSVAAEAALAAADMLKHAEYYSHSKSRAVVKIANGDC